MQRHKILMKRFKNKFSAFIYITVQKYKAEDNSERYF